MAATPSDVIDKTIGSFGKYQALMFILVLVGMIPADIQLQNIVFIIPKVDYVCLDENANNATNRCPCQNPQYDESEMLSSVTSEWNLICDRTILASLAQSVIQLGCLIGSVGCGYLSDRYGRKRVVCAAIVLSAFLISLSAISPNIWTFIVIRFFTGIPVGGILACGYVFIIEFTGTSFRSKVFLIVMSLYMVTYFGISLISYLVREWRYIQFYTSAPWILTLVYFWILPESPRWLHTLGRTQELIELLTKIARRNGLSTEHIAVVVKEADKGRPKSENYPEQRVSITDLFKTPKLRLFSICGALLYMIISHSIFGIGQYIGRLQGNLYINTMLTALFLVPSLVLYIIFTKFLKRKIGIVLGLSISGLSLILFVLTPNSVTYLNLAFIILATLALNTSLILTYLFLSEIFPTIIRNSAFGFAATLARLGSTLAPFVVNIGIEWVTITIFITLLIFAIFFCCLLPETKGMVLINTIEELEARNDGTVNEATELPTVSDICVSKAV